MKTKIELTIRGEPTQLQLLLARVESNLRDGWKRDRLAEERLGSRGPWDYCFACTSTSNRPAVGFWVHPRNSNELYISTVVPLEKKILTEEEINSVLDEFDREFLAPVAAEVGAETKIVQHRLDLEHALSAEAVRLLRALSACPNGSRLNPKDRQRWNDFLVQVYQDEALFDPTLLDEWLQEAGWPADSRNQLAQEYVAAQSLLSSYDEKAKRR